MLWSCFWHGWGQGWGALTHKLWQVKLGKLEGFPPWAVCSTLLLHWFLLYWFLLCPYVGLWAVRVERPEVPLNPPEDLAVATEEVVAPTAMDWQPPHPCWLSFQGLQLCLIPGQKRMCWRSLALSLSFPCMLSGSPGYHLTPAPSAETPTFCWETPTYWPPCVLGSLGDFCFADLFACCFWPLTNWYEIVAVGK